MCRCRCCWIQTPGMDGPLVQVGGKPLWYPDFVTKNTLLATSGNAWNMGTWRWASFSEGSFSWSVRRIIHAVFQGYSTEMWGISTFQNDVTVTPGSPRTNATTLTNAIQHLCLKFEEMSIHARCPTQVPFWWPFWDIIPSVLPALRDVFFCFEKHQVEMLRWHF